MMRPAVLIVENDAALREAMLHALQTGEHPVFAAASEADALTILNRESIGLVLGDMEMQSPGGNAVLGEIRERHPALPAVIMSSFGTIETAVDAMRNGAADYLVKPFATSELQQVVIRHMRALPGANPVAADARTMEILRVAERVATTNATVTISGESGCGKEVFARFIHDRSTRHHRPFVAINCAAIPENMLEAMLFGHEKGAFTGATAAHPGKFEQAEGGTLLLDEISEMQPGLQAKLLRVIQEKEVERLGARSAIRLDVRVLATTNRDLRRQVAEGTFREDLYYRLNVFPLHIPPLRARPGDIEPLAALAIQKHCRADRPLPVLADCARQKLARHMWPGNVRELENVVQRSLIMLQGNTLTASDLIFEAPEEFAASSTDPTPTLQGDLKEREYHVIVDALREAGGSRTQAAERLCISPRTLRYKLARMRQDGLTLPDETATRHRRLFQGQHP